jgi:hypothetical protein
MISQPKRRVPAVLTGLAAMIALSHGDLSFGQYPVTTGELTVEETSGSGNLKLWGDGFIIGRSNPESYSSPVLRYEDNWGRGFLWHPGKGSLTLGGWAEEGSIGMYSFVAGSNGSAPGYHSTVLGGYYTTASGGWSLASGYGATATGSFSLAMGYAALAHGYSAFAFGHHSTAYGQSAVALGSSTTAYGNSATALGSGTSAFGTSATALGDSTAAGAFASVAIGRYNLGAYAVGGDINWIPTDPVFEIGNGTQGTRSNALTVLKNGKTTLFNATTRNPAIVLDPNAGSILVNNQPVLTAATNGNVGIGTATPSSPLVVSNPTSNKLTLTGGSAQGGAQNGMTFDAVGGSHSFYVYSGAAFNGGGMGIYNPATGAQPLTILNNANIGLNATNPLSALQIGMPDPVDIYNAATRVRVFGSALQSTADETMLRFIRDHNPSQFYPAVVDFKVGAYQGGGPGSNYNPATKLTVALKDAQWFEEAADVNVMTLLGNGKVGIGTGEPSERLHVNGKVRADGGIVVPGARAAGSSPTSVVIATPGKSLLVPQQGDIPMGEFTAGTAPTALP